MLSKLNDQYNSLKELFFLKNRKAEIYSFQLRRSGHLWQLTTAQGSFYSFESPLAADDAMRANCIDSLIGYSSVAALYKKKILWLFQPLLFPHL